MTRPLTFARSRHWWVVWCFEYPEEPSVKVLAATRTEAVRKAGKLMGSWWVGGRAVAQRMTLKQIHARGREK